MSSREAKKLGLVDHVLDRNVVNADQILTSVKQLVNEVMDARVSDASFTSSGITTSGAPGPDRSAQLPQTLRSQRCSRSRSFATRSATSLTSLPTTATAVPPPTVSSPLKSTSSATESTSWTR